MLAIIDFTQIIVTFLLEAIIWVVIINAVLSWLIAFQVINVRNRAVYSIVSFLDAVTRPILAPVRRIIPTLGGVDISPVILIVVIQAALVTLIPALFNGLRSLAGGA